MTKRRSALWPLIGLCLALLLAASGLAVGMGARALTEGSTVEYPFATGAAAFSSAPTFTTVETQEIPGNWEFIQVKFDAATADLSNAKYIAAQIRADKGNPGITAGVLEGGNRFTSIGTDTDKCYYFLPEAGTLSKCVIQYDSINMGLGACGTLLMPVANMSWQWNTGDMTKIDSFYITTSTQFNFNWALTVGEVGYYTGEPGEAGTQFVKLVDLSKGERAKSKYYVASSNPYFMEMPSDRNSPNIRLANYPYRRGPLAFGNSFTWTAPAEASAESNVQTLAVSFDAAADSTSATYLAIQYKADLGTPALHIALKAGDKRLGTVLDGKPVYFANEGSTEAKGLSNVAGGAVKVAKNAKGMLLIPMDSLAWETEAGALTAVEGIELTADSKTVFGYKVTVGEIGFFVGEPGTASWGYQNLLDLTVEKADKAAVTSGAEPAGTLTVNTMAVTKKGDATVDFTAEGRTADSFPVWDGGSLGTVEIVKDSYDGDAVRITPTGNDPSGDPYVAVTLTDPAGFSWGGMKGVSFWARNDSDTEVSFNIEVDCRAPVVKNGVPNTLKDRFNIKQGNRYWLYDINTGKTGIYMTRPTATLPVGFEGWVRIPFTAFARADWSNNGVTPADFMKPGSTVEYLAVTVLASAYIDKSFSINSFGAYATSPTFVSSFVPSGGNSIPELMGL